MYLHLKTCSAVLLEPCPSSHPGCQDARKLLAHYRRCRDIRARQAQNPASKSQHQHVCLVCSLVARHAKFSLDRTIPGCRTNGPKGGTSSHYIPSLNLSYETSEGTPSDNLGENRKPRFAFSRPLGGGSGSGFQALQAAVSCAMNSNPTNGLDPIGEDSTVGQGRGFMSGSLHRPRSESLDARRMNTAPSHPKEQGEKNMSYLYLAAVGSLEEEEETSARVRRRSQSCSVPSTKSPSSTTASCDPILDKPIGEDLKCIFGGES